MEILVCRSFSNSKRLLFDVDEDDLLDDSEELFMVDTQDSSHQE